MVEAPATKEVLLPNMVVDLGIYLEEDLPNMAQGEEEAPATKGAIQGVLPMALCLMNGVEAGRTALVVLSDFGVLLGTTTGEAVGAGVMDQRPAASRMGSGVVTGVAGKVGTVTHEVAPTEILAEGEEVEVVVMRIEGYWALLCVCAVELRGMSPAIACFLLVPEEGVAEPLRAIDRFENLPCFVFFSWFSLPLSSTCDATSNNVK